MKCNRSILLPGAVSGLGTQLIGSVNIYEMPDTGNIDIAFVADEFHPSSGFLEKFCYGRSPTTTALVLDNDSVSFNFVMVSGLPTQQVWTTSFMQIPQIAATGQILI